MILPITKLPSRVLRSPVKPVSLPAKKQLLRLVQDMLHTCRKADGIGLAGPQVSQSLNLALINLEEHGIPPFIIINPVITHRSKETTTVEEGCLSMPGVFGEVSRPKKITVEFYDLEGKKHSLTDDGWIARVIQHEIDHLQSVLIIDKLKKVTQGKELLKKYETN